MDFEITDNVSDYAVNKRSGKRVTSANYVRWRANLKYNV